MDNPFVEGSVPWHYQNAKEWVAEKLEGNVWFDKSGSAWRWRKVSDAERISRREIWLALIDPEDCPREWKRHIGGMNDFYPMLISLQDRFTNR
jgi:hypothetical protein